jgi:hypothetical protein
MLVLRVMEETMVKRGITGELSMTLEDNFMINRFLEAIGAIATRRIEFTANSYPADNDCQMKLRPPGLHKTEFRLARRPSDHECARARRAASLTRDLPACPPLPGRSIAGDGLRPMRSLRCNKRRIPPGNPSSVVAQQIFPRDFENVPLGSHLLQSQNLPVDETKKYL